MEAAFYENFTEAAGAVTPELDDTPAGTDEEGAAFIVRSSPSGGANDLKRLYLLGSPIGARSRSPSPRRTS